MTATYYIEVDTYWQNSRSYFVGPFASRREAEAWGGYANWDNKDNDWTPADNTWLSTSQCGGDISGAWRIYPAPLSKTEARKHGMRRYEDRDEEDNTLPTHTRCSAVALNSAARHEEEARY